MASPAPRKEVIGCQVGRLELRTLFFTAPVGNSVKLEGRKLKSRYICGVVFSDHFVKPEDTIMTAR